MAYGSYFNKVTDSKSLASRFVSEKRDVFCDIPYAPASEWDRQHLFACRVIRRSKQYDILPVLSIRVGSRIFN